MKLAKVKVSKNGPELSEIIFGTWRLCDTPSPPKTQDLLKLFDHCLELGMSSFDLADIYGNYECEATFGHVVKERRQIRDSIQLISKAGIVLVSDKNPDVRIKHYNTSPEYLQASIQKSLNLLQTSYLDLFLIHRPSPFMNYKETASTLNQFVKDGLSRHVGVSNFTTQEFENLQYWLDVPLASNQIEINPLNLDAFDNGTLNQCQKHGLSPLAWSPLAGGRLFDQTSNPELYRVMEQISQAKGCDLSTIALAWLMTHPSRIIPIIGTLKAERVELASKAATVKLSRQEWFEIYTAAKGHEVP